MKESFEKLKNKKIVVSLFFLVVVAFILCTTKMYTDYTTIQDYTARVDTLESNAKTIETENTQLRARVEALSDDIKNLRASLDDANTQLDEANAQIEELSKLKDQQATIDDLNQKISEQSATIADLKSQITSLEGENAELKSASANVSHTSDSDTHSSYDEDSGYGGGGTVYITATGSKYHRSGCRYLKKSKISISEADAISQGYSACSVCDP